MCQCPLGLELLRGYSSQHVVSDGFNALSGLSCYKEQELIDYWEGSFNALMGLSCYVAIVVNMWFRTVSMPSRA